eukprot:CAMPEP_0119074416 /NCGR_PEP_ID=MMETSP1178-20130426/72101_1 /TAXON_ID=33656 /ORGANISM="unid sp, Strain CCMP2000" /LENGTH=199 /DNA_ID=CAMNT_0007056573 /DNA_START=22 /DNA_END=621 /DNA_ORIENTATION=-
MLRNRYCPLLRHTLFVSSRVPHARAASARHIHALLPSANPACIRLAPLLTARQLLGAHRMLCTSTSELVTTKSGLMYRDVLVPEGGRGPNSGDTVRVHYTGRLEDGTVFDSSHQRGEPISFELGTGRVIRGWDEGVAGMVVGGTRQLVIPPNLGYGTRGAPPAIPPNALLHFDVELVEISAPGGWLKRLASMVKALPFR